MFFNHLLWGKSPHVPLRGVYPSAETPRAMCQGDSSLRPARAGGAFRSPADIEKGMARADRPRVSSVASHCQAVAETARRPAEWTLDTLADCGGEAHQTVWRDYCRVNNQCHTLSECNVTQISSAKTHTKAMTNQTASAADKVLNSRTDISSFDFLQASATSDDAKNVCILKNRTAAKIPTHRVIAKIRPFVLNSFNCLFFIDKPADEIKRFRRLVRIIRINTYK